MPAANANDADTNTGHFTWLNNRSKKCGAVPNAALALFARGLASRRSIKRQTFT